MVDIKLVEKLLTEGKECIDKGDPIQASEKLYKVVEECIKLLAEKKRLAEYEEAKKEGRWWSRLLMRAARRLARDLNEGRIEVVWAEAFELHIWGFHEKALNIEHIQPDLPYVEWLLNYTKEALNKEGDGVPEKAM